MIADSRESYKTHTPSAMPIFLNWQQLRIKKNCLHSAIAIIESHYHVKCDAYPNFW